MTPPRPGRPRPGYAGANAPAALAHLDGCSYPAASPRLVPLAVTLPFASPLESLGRDPRGEGRPVPERMPGRLPLQGRKAQIKSPSSMPASCGTASAPTSMNRLSPTPDRRPESGIPRYSSTVTANVALGDDPIESNSWFEHRPPLQHHPVGPQHYPFHHLNHHEEVPAGGWPGGCRRRRREATSAPSPSTRCETLRAACATALTRSAPADQDRRHPVAAVPCRILSSILQRPLTTGWEPRGLTPRRQGTWSASRGQGDDLAAHLTREMRPRRRR